MKRIHRAVRSTIAEHSPSACRGMSRLALPPRGGGQRTSSGAFFRIVRAMSSAAARTRPNTSVIPITAKGATPEHELRFEAPSSCSSAGGRAAFADAERLPPAAGCQAIAANRHRRSKSHPWTGRAVCVIGLSRTDQHCVSHSSQPTKPGLILGRSPWWHTPSRQSQIAVRAGRWIPREPEVRASIGPVRTSGSIPNEWRIPCDHPDRR